MWERSDTYNGVCSKRARAVSNGEARCISLADDTGRGGPGMPAPHAVRDFLTALGMIARAKHITYLIAFIGVIV